MVMWKCHVDEPNEGKYGIISDRYWLTSLVLDIKLYEHVIIGGAGTYEGCLEYMVDISNYYFKYIPDRIC